MHNILSVAFMHLTESRCLYTYILFVYLFPSFVVLLDYNRSVLNTVTFMHLTEILLNYNTLGPSLWFTRSNFKLQLVIWDSCDLDMLMLCYKHNQ